MLPTKSTLIPLLGLLALVFLRAESCLDKLTGGDDDETTLTCQFTSGPLAGRTITFSFGEPAKVGEPCTDGNGSYGVAVRGLKTSVEAAVDNGGPTSPVRGLWQVVQGPPCPNPDNQHCLTAASRDALELIPIDGSGQLLNCLGQPIYSPVAGVVTEVVDVFADYPAALPSDTDELNALTIVADDGSEVYQLLHIQQGSARVGPGAHVERGQQVAQCGHNGVSARPHLQIHRGDGVDTTTPIVFRSIDIIRNGTCERVDDHSVQRGDVLCTP